MNKVVTFGELMLRLQPQGYQRFIQTDSYHAVYGGGEANVAVALACFGQEVKYVTKLPLHDIGQAGINSLRKFGVDTTEIVRGGERIGLYYIEKGASERPSRVVYDRKYSAIAEACPEEFDWDRILNGAGWLHISGITQAISPNAAKACLEACKKAKEKKITVSFDMNYRSKLWSVEAAREAVIKIAPYIDVCIASEWDAVNIFGIEKDIVTSGEDPDPSKQTYLIEKLAARYGYSLVATTRRDSISASVNGFSAQLYDGRNFFYSPKYNMQMIDRVGGGDAFAAGLIYTQINGYLPQDSINFAVAAGCLKHSIEGDFNLVSVSEVNSLALGDGSGRVSR